MTAASERDELRHRIGEVLSLPWVQNLSDPRGHDVRRILTGDARSTRLAGALAGGGLEVAVEWGPGEWHPDPCRARPAGREASAFCCLERDQYDEPGSPATCPKCGGEPTMHRHYPTEYGSPVDRRYCGPCDQEWWSDDA